MGLLSPTRQARSLLGAPGLVLLTAQAMRFSTAQCGFESRTRHQGPVAGLRPLRFERGFEGSIPSGTANFALARGSGGCRAKAAIVVRLHAGALGTIPGSSNGRTWAFEAQDESSILSPGTTRGSPFGDGSWPTPSRAEFDSLASYRARVAQPEEAAALSPAQCRFESCGAHPGPRPQPVGLPAPAL